MKRVLRTGVAVVAALTTTQVGLVTGTAVAAPSAAAASTQTITVGNGPTRIAVDSAAHRAYTTNASGSVSAIDTSNNTVVKTVTLGSRPFGVAVDPSTDTLYVTQRDTGTLVRLDATTLRVTGSVNVGGTPASVAVDPGSQTAYTANGNAHSVSVVDLGQLTVTDTIGLTDPSLPADVAIDPDTHKVFVTSSGTDYNFYVIDTRSHVATAVNVGDYTYGVAIDPVAHLAYLGSAKNGAVRVYDTTTNAFNFAIPLGAGQDRQGTSFGVALDRQAKALYVSNGSGSSVRVVDLTNRSVAETVPTGSSPYGVAVDTSTHSAYVANSGTTTVTALSPRSFGPQPQSISFDTTPPADPEVDGTYDVSATGGGSGNPVTFSIDASSDSGTCAVADHGDSTGTVSFTGAGQCVLDADQAGNSGYDAAPQAQQSFAVAGRDAQAITFTSTPPSPAYVGDDYAVTATGGGSGQPVTFSTSTGDVCTVADNGDSTGTVSFTGTGSCEIDADQAGAQGYDAAPTATQSVEVSQEPAQNPYANTDTVAVGSGPNTVATDSGSHRTYVTNGDANTVSVINTRTHKVVDTIQVGSRPYGITLDTAADRAYVANNASGTVSVIDTGSGTVVSTITGIGSLPDGVAVDPGTQRLYVTRNGDQVSVIDTAGNRYLGAISVRNEPTAVAVDPGTHTAYVTNASNRSVSVIDTTTSTVTKTITVGARPVRVAVDATAHRAYVTNLNDRSVSVIDTTTATVTGEIEVGSSPFGVGTDPVAGVVYVGNAGDGTVSIIDEASGSVVQTVPVGRRPQGVGVDTSSHTAFVANNLDGTVSVIERTGTVKNQPQAITFTTDPPSPAYVGDTYTVKATGGGSGNPVTFTGDRFDPDPNGNGEPNCLVSDNGDSTASVYFSETGTCNIYADQAGSTGYDAAPQAVQTFTIGQRAQTITFTSDPPSPAYAGTSYTVSATGGDSGNNVTFASGDATTDDACSVTNNGDSTALVQLTGAGTCDVVASQQGSTTYADATAKHQTFDVALQPQAITFTTGAPTNAKVGGSYTVSASGGGSGNAVTFSRDSSSDQGTCTVDDNGDSTAKVSFTGRGDCVIDADQAGSRAYQAAPQAQQTVAVSPKAQHITLTDNAPLQARVGKSYTVKGTGGASGKPVTFRRDASSDPMTCAVADNGDSTATVTFTGTGSCVVDGDQSGAKGFSAAPQAQLPLATGATKQAISITSAKQARYPVDTTYTVTAKAGASGNAVVFRIDGTTTADCDIVGGGQNGSTYSATVSFSGVGQCVVVANEAGSATYQPAPQQKLSLKVNAAQQAITFTTTPPDPGHVGDTYDVAATGGRSGNPVTFSIANPTKASCSIVSTGDSKARVTFNVAHPCVILAAQAASADGNYNSAPGQRQVVTVRK